MGLYEPPSISDLFVAWREDRLDNIDLFGVYGEFAAKAELRAEAGVFDQGGFVVEVDVECVNGLQAVGCRMGHDSAARIKDFPAGFRSSRADVTRQIFCTKDQGVQPIACSRNVAEVHHTARGFDDDQQADVCPIKLPINPLDLLGTFNFGQHEAIGVVRQCCVEIGLLEAGADRVNTHHTLRSTEVQVAQRSRNRRTGLDLAIERDAVFRSITIESTPRLMPFWIFLRSSPGMKSKQRRGRMYGS